MSEVKRISAEATRAAVVGGKSLLICAYESDEKFQSFHLEGAISFSDFNNRIDGLEKDTDIIFYCAWKNEGSAAGLADRYMKLGYTNVAALKGGPAAWKDAGFPAI